MVYFCCQEPLKCIEVNFILCYLHPWMDRYGLKLEKTGQFFQVLEMCLRKVAKNEIQVALCAINIIYFLVSGLSGMLYV